MRNKKLVFIFLLMFLPVFNVKAYSNRYFNIDMPSEYKISMEKDGTYQWVNDKEGSNYVVSIRLRDDDESIVKYSEKKRNDFVDGIVSSLSNQYYSNYGIEVPVRLDSSSLTKFNNYDSIYLKIGITNFLSTEKDMNQYMYIVESKNLMYSIVYSTFKDTYNKKDFEKIESSFKVKDELITSNTEEITKGIAFAIINILVGFGLCQVINKRGLFKRK